MEARAQVNHVRISPRKVKIVLDLIRNKPVDVAIAIVHNTPKSACEPLEKLLKSAVANAENNHNMDLQLPAHADISIKQSLIFPSITSLIAAIQLSVPSTDK